MNYWILKSEPDVYGYDQLVKEGSVIWDGVRNYQARNNLKAMEIGDRAFFYHSNIGLEIVGEVEICTSHFKDPTSDDDKWVAVKISPVRRFATNLKLAEIKADPFLQNIALVRNGRLSVMPISIEEYHHILKKVTI